MSARQTPAGVDDPQDGSPSWDEVEQHEELPELPIAAVPVHVDGPVQTHALPPRTSVVRTLVVGVEPTELVGLDLRRASVLIIPVDEAIWVGKTTTDCRVPPGGTEAPGGLLPPAPMGGGYRLYGSSRLFCACAVAEITRVTVIAESWAD
jgi:hypothetical protein